MRYANRIDNSQNAIVKALEAAGASVEVIKQPLDLLVGFRRSWGVLEIKSSKWKAEKDDNNPSRKRQREFAERHPNGGPIGTVWDIEGALRFLALLGSKRL